MYLSVNCRFIPQNLCSTSEGTNCIKVGENSIVCDVDNNVQYKIIDGAFCILQGSIYDKNQVNIETIYSLYKKGGHDALLGVDGEFLFICVCQDGSCVVVTDREGDIPIYYREDKAALLLSTECQDLFFDFSIPKINERSINDFLRFGTLVGDQTMHNDVFLLQGGSELNFNPGRGVHKKRNYRFHYEEKEATLDKITEQVFYAYSKGVQKRIAGQEKDTCIFLSGGMDSRLLLAVSNDVTDEKVTAVTFGQKNSEEVHVARLCTEVQNNDFNWIQVSPSDFVQNAEQYMYLTCGGDMFPQSYIINAAQRIQKKNFATGFALDAYMGGTFLNDEVLKSRDTLTDFLKDHLGLMKMSVFSKEELYDIQKGDMDSPFKTDIDSILQESKQWNDYSVRDSIQAFAIDNRAKRCVQLREVVPGRSMHRINPSSDIDFLKAASTIPAEYRINHRFYHGMFLKYVSKYSDIPYNNTTLPVSAPVDMWKQGSANEAVREKLYAEFMAAYNKTHEEKLYYPHYYSDFEGYSRYDKEWISLFEKYLLNPNAIIVNLWFEKQKIIQLYQDHITGRKNNRKKLIFLTSLEIFLRNNISN